MTKTQSNNSISNYIISISSSSVSNENSLPENSLYEGNVFTSLPNENSWITYHFPNRRIHLKSYTIVSSPDNIGYSDLYLRCWTVSGSNDNITWKILDRHVNNQIFSQRDQAETFDCDNYNSHSSFSYIRVMITCQNSDSNYYLRVRQIEFFGTLFDKKYDFYEFPSITMNYYVKSYSFLLFSLLLIKVF